MLRKVHADLILLELTAVDDQGDVVGRERRQHDAWRTWFSRVLAEGAHGTHARWAAWSPPHDLRADYTSMPWETLCGVVDGLDMNFKRTQKSLRRA
jgi:hypothetical protein